MKRLSVLLLFCLSLPAVASDFWHGPDGQPLPDTASHQTKRGFSGAVVITADRDWSANWHAPGTGLPSVTEADRGAPRRAAGHPDLLRQSQARRRPQGRRALRHRSAAPRWLGVGQPEEPRLLPGTVAGRRAPHLPRRAGGEVPGRARRPGRPLDGEGDLARRRPPGDAAAGNRIHAGGLSPTRTQAHEDQDHEERADRRRADEHRRRAGVFARCSPTRPSTRPTRW